MPRKKSDRHAEAPESALALAPILPVVTEETVQQSRSRTLLEQTVSPWLVTQCTHYDYGMDAMVDVLAPRGDGGAGHFNTGRRIGIQLKATEKPIRGGFASLKVKVRTLKYWMAGTEPFALVACHLPTGTLAYRWIDDSLVAELDARDSGWFTQESTTVRVSWDALLSSTRLREMDCEARLIVVRRHRVLAAGTYDRLLTTSRQAMKVTVAAARAAGFQSVTKQLDDANEVLARTTYVVAVAGRMRAGKSTLFNAIIRREVSPVGRRPTTAVAVLATSGATDEACVAFGDGRRTTIPADANSLAQYATQDENAENHKGVRLITVRLVSPRLERGVAIVDAPGLFDPSEEIRNVTARTLARANAVLFVMDVSAARSGGFAVDAHVLDELRRVLDHSDRVFLLLNKADELKEADRQDVLATLSTAFSRDGLEKRLAGPPSFISAERAWKWVADGAKRGPSPIADLEDSLWDYLLSTSAIGVVRLEAAVRTSSAAIDDALSFVAVRRATSTALVEVRTRLTTARSKIADLQGDCARRAEEDLATAEANLRAALDAIPGRIAAELHQRGAAASKEVVDARKNALLNEAFGTVWESARRALELHAQETNDLLEAALQQARFDHSPASPSVFALPRHDFLPVNLLGADAFGWGAVGAAVGFIIAPAASIVAGLASFIFGAWLGRGKQLKREIVRIEAGLRSYIQRELKVPTDQFLGEIRVDYRRISRHVSDRWKVYEKDLSAQLAAADAPLTHAESERLDRLERELRGAKTTLAGVAEEIRWTPAPRESVASVAATPVP